MSDCLTVPVELADRSYDVLIGQSALETAAGRTDALFASGRTIVVTDSEVARHHLDRVTDWLTDAGIRSDCIILPAGEATKSFAQLENLVEQLLELRFERSETLIALGGGVIGDLAGFASAITKRGTGFVQMPTTLLAQVDSSVGGKTGINTSHGKNLAGAFHQPRLVVADARFIETLPERELKAGYAEIVKAALIGDKDFFEHLDTLGAAATDARHLPRAVANAVAFKAAIVAEDERETGRRALLNLGHTFGHAFEADAPKNTIRHGEAVAVGLALAFAYSAHKGLCPQADADRVSRHLRAIGLPAAAAELAHTQWSAPSLAARMRNDKKNTGGRITLVLAHGIGNAYIDPDTDETDLVSFMETQLR